MLRLPPPGMFAQPDPLAGQVARMQATLAAKNAAAAKERYDAMAARHAVEYRAAMERKAAEEKARLAREAEERRKAEAMRAQIEADKARQKIAAAAWEETKRTSRLQVERQVQKAQELNVPKHQSMPLPLVAAAGTAVGKFIAGGGIAKVAGFIGGLFKRKSKSRAASPIAVAQTATQRLPVASKIVYGDDPAAGSSTKSKSGLMTWIKENTALAIGIGVVAFLFFTGSLKKLFR